MAMLTAGFRSRTAVTIASPRLCVVGDQQVFRQDAALPGNVLQNPSLPKPIPISAEAAILKDGEERGRRAVALAIERIVCRKAVPAYEQPGQTLRSMRVAVYLAVLAAENYERSEGFYRCKRAMYPRACRRIDMRLPSARPQVRLAHRFLVFERISPKSAFGMADPFV